MTVRLVSLSLAVLLFLVVAAPASAAGPWVVPGGLVGRLAETLEQPLDWINTLIQPVAEGPELHPSG